MICTAVNFLSTLHALLCRAKTLAAPAPLPNTPTTHTGQFIVATQVRGPLFPLPACIHPSVPQWGAPLPFKHIIPGCCPFPVAPMPHGFASLKLLLGNIWLCCVKRHIGRAASAK